VMVVLAALDVVAVAVAAGTIRAIPSVLILLLKKRNLQTLVVTSFVVSGSGPYPSMTTPFLRRLLLVGVSFLLCLFVLIRFLLVALLMPVLEPHRHHHVPPPERQRSIFSIRTYHFCSSLRASTGASSS